MHSAPVRNAVSEAAASEFPDGLFCAQATVRTIRHIAVNRGFRLIFSEKESYPEG